MVTFVGAAARLPAAGTSPEASLSAISWRRCNVSRLSMRAPLPTTDALFAQEVEQKMNNLLGWFWRRAIIPGSNQTSHRNAACSCRNFSRHIEVRIQPAWVGGFELRCTQADRLGRGSQCGRDGDCGQETVQPNREDHSPLGPQPSPPRRLNPKPRDVSKR